MLAFTAILLPLGASIQLQNQPAVSYQNQELNPGEIQTLAEITLDYDEDAQVVEVTDDQFPFDINDVVIQDLDQTVIIRIQADVPDNASETFLTEDQTQVTVQNSVGDTTTDNVTLEYSIHPSVEETNNITINPQNITGNISTGSESGIFRQVNISQQGNKVQTLVSFNTQGNVSELFYPTEGEIPVFETSDGNLRLRNDVQEQQETGTYYGNITFQNGDQTRVMDMEVEVVDDIPPEITEVTAEDVMATLPSKISAEVTDNQQVQNVTAEIMERDGFNQTSIGTIQLDQDVVTWSKNFNKTDEVGEYLVNVTAVDENNNTAYEEAIFNIEELDTLRVLEDNFRMDAVEPEDTSEKEIVRIEDHDTPLEMKMDFFVHDVDNSSITVSVRKKREETGQNFELSEESDTITIEEVGVYVLEVRSDSDESYRGEINLTAPESHVDLETNEILFEGVIVDAEYPSPRDFGVGNFRGEIGFADSDRAVQEEIVFKGTAPAEICEGYDNFANCIPGLDFGEMERVENENEELQDDVNFWKNVAKGSLAFTVIFILAYWRKENLEGTVKAYRPVKY